MRHPGRSWRSWALIVAYPLLLLAAFGAHIARVHPIASYDHLAGILFGVSVGVGSRLAPPALLAAALATLIWSPWSPAWRAAHGRLPAVESLESPPRGSAGDSGNERQIFVVNAGRGKKSFHWIDRDGNEHLDWTTHRPAFTHYTGQFEIFPRALSDRWTVRDDNGRLLAAYDLSRNPHSALLLDLRAGE